VRLTHSLGLGVYEYPLQAADARDYLQSRPTRPQLISQVATLGSEAL